MNRREFAKKASAAAVGATVLPHFNIGQSGTSPNSRLNLAFIGSGNIAKMAFTETTGENWVALCDVDQLYLDEAKATYPEAANARTFKDFRVMFDEMADEIDGVCVSTPDHTHFVAAMWAIEAGKHLCVQKPLTRTVWEARTLNKAAKKKKLITNMANQGHTYDGIRQAREWLEHGLIGDVHTVHSWEGGPTWGNGWFELPETNPPPAEPIPESLDWDLWCGPLEMRDFSSYYHPKKWLAFYDLGTGMLGDWFCHTCDAPVWALDLYEPESVELIAKGGLNPDGVISDRTIIKWRFPKRNGKPACDLMWYEGGLKPSIPDKWTWGNVPARGSFFMGDKNVLFTDERSNNPKLVNRDEMIAFKQAGYPKEKYPRVTTSGPFGEWVAAVRGDGPMPGSSFDYASRLTEVALLGVLAQRFEGRIEWDSKNGRITNRPELNAWLREPVRKGWEIGQQYLINL